jgi:anti-anti-sigma factor
MAEAFTVRVTEQRDGVAVVALVGELDADGAASLEDHLGRLNPQPSCIRFDASRLDFLGAAGLRCLLTAERRLGRGQVTVAHPTASVRKVLAACDLLHLVAR